MTNQLTRALRHSAAVIATVAATGVEANVMTATVLGATMGATTVAGQMWWQFEIQMLVSFQSLGAEKHNHLERVH